MRVTWTGEGACLHCAMIGVIVDPQNDKTGIAIALALVVVFTFAAIAPIRSYDFFWRLATGRRDTGHWALPDLGSCLHFASVRQLRVTCFSMPSWTCRKPFFGSGMVQ